MPASTEGRVAVYIDFDNIVISRYSQTHGGGRRKTELLRDITIDALRDDPHPSHSHLRRTLEIRERVETAIGREHAWHTSEALLVSLDG